MSQLLTAADCLRSTATEWGSSRWAAHNRCGEEYDLRYNKRVYRLPIVRDAEPLAAGTKPIPFRVGTIVHAGIRLVESGTFADPIEALSAVADAAAQDPQFSPYDVVEGQRLLEAYWAHWGHENAAAPGWQEGITVVGTEIQLKAAGLRHTGAIDTLLKLPSGELLIVDTKTRAQKLPDDAARRFATNPQFLSLSYMAQEQFELASPPALVVNAVIKTKIPGFDRVRVSFTQAQVDEWAINQAAIEARDLLVASAPVVRNYSLCAPAIGSPCDYFDYCHGSDEEKQMKFGKGRQSEPHITEGEAAA